MSDRRLLLVFLLVAATFVLAGACGADDAAKTAGDESPLRQWTDTTGRFQIDAAFVSYHDGKVQLRRFDGKLLSVDLSRLSKPDRDYVRSRLKEAETTAAKASETELPILPPKEAEEESESTPSRHTGLPDPNCPLCRGLGLVPHKKLAAYVHVEGQPTPDPADSIIGRYCPKCQGGKDPARLLEAEAARLKTAGRRHKEWEAKLQMPLTRIETHQIVIHSQLPPADSRRVAQALEVMTNHLEELTGTLVLTPRRPATDDLFLFTGKDGYERLIGCLEADPLYKGLNWDLMRRLSGGTVNRITMIHGPLPVPPENLAVHGSANRQIQIAAVDRAPPWLSEGFAAYCEFAALKRNLVHSVDAQSNEVNPGANWDVQIRQLARLGRLRTWDEMFKKELAEFEAIHYLESKSMAAFLLQQPDKFQDLVDAFAAGATSPAGLEEAYGKPAKDLEAEWRRWLGAR